MNHTDPTAEPCSCRTNPTWTAQIGYPVRCPHCPPGADTVPPTHWTKHVQRHHPAAVSAVVAPPTDRAVLRDRIADAVRRTLDPMTSGPRISADTIADAVLAVLGEQTDRAAVLTEAERTMLTYALDQAQERIWSEDGFTDEDQAALNSLRRLAVEAHDTGTQQPELQPARDDQFEAWLKTQYVRHVRLKDYAICDALNAVLSLYGLCADAATQQEPAPVAQQPAAEVEPEPSDPTQCSGEEGFCPEHGFHRHSLKQPAPVQQRGTEAVTEAEAERLATLADCPNSRAGDLHCDHYQQGDGPCCNCQRPNWCPDGGVA